MIDQAVRDAAALGPPGPRLPRLAPPVHRAGPRPAGALGDGPGVEADRSAGEMAGEVVTALVDDFLGGSVSDTIGGLIDGFLSLFS
ncbi:hypothetical protein [Kitasatospora sp. NPDC050463]|uniref:hypothetical protein n=1 Tax=Kitasatospora sp. NPDC050463 TaxID=3155786 RepID=UPI0033D1D682